MFHFKKIVFPLFMATAFLCSCSQADDDIAGNAILTAKDFDA